MKFSYLVETFKELEKTSSRNDMIDILSKLAKNATEENIDKICYFVLGNIAAGYEDIKLGMGDEMVKSAIAFAAGIEVSETEREMLEAGDLGEVAFKLIEKKENRFSEYLNIEEQLTVNDVFKGLMKITEAKGTGSQEVKQKTLAALLSNANREETRYVVRLATGEMRLGVGDMTVLDALASAFLDSKEKRSNLERAYNVCSDIGYVAKVLFKSGLDGVNRIRVALNRPIRPMLAQRISEISEIMEKIESDLISVEEKFDGERIQAHKDTDKVKLFSRRLTDVTDQFPEVVKGVRDQISVGKAIFDGEVVAYDFDKEEFYPFQKLMQRRRKYDVKDYAEKFPVKYMLFDVLYVDGLSFMRKSYPERRKKLEKIVTDGKYLEITDRITSSKLDEIEDYFQECLNMGLEGIVCKSCSDDSVYRAGAREWLWIKWKQSYVSEMSDTFDLVVLGAYAGKGKRGGKYGALLCGSYNHEKDIYQTVCKLGSGFSDEQLDELPEKLKDAKVDKKPTRVSVNKEMRPDYWFDPKYVLEVLASEITESPSHTCNWEETRKRGLALRFPRFKRWRIEKSPEQTTTVKEIVDMYSSK